MNANGVATARFNSQPPEGGWVKALKDQGREQVSTHSRPKAAGADVRGVTDGVTVSTHSRPKAAGTVGEAVEIAETVSTHSRPKAAGGIADKARLFAAVSTHSRPKAAGLLVDIFARFVVGFNSQPPEGGWCRR